MKKQMLSILLAMTLLFTSTDATSFTAIAAETAMEESSTSQNASQTLDADTTEEAAETGQTPSEESRNHETETAEEQPSTAPPETTEAPLETATATESASMAGTEEETVTVPNTETETETATVPSTETETETETESETATEEGDVKSALSDFDIEGNNSIGKMLADEMQSEQGGDNQTINSGSGISAIKINGTTATVSYMTVQDCTAVVGIFADQGGRLLAIGTGNVASGTGTAELEILSGRLPQYYEVRGFLIRTDTLQPLSNMYISEEYTQEIQEFRQKTTADFAQDQVLNLDTAEENNFLVYDEGVQRILMSDTANTLTEQNDENGTYKFENADDTLKNVQKGDIVAFEREENDLNAWVVKIYDIQVSGDTVAIGIDAANEPGITDVFDYIRLDTRELVQNNTPETRAYSSRDIGQDEDGTALYQQGTFIDETINKELGEISVEAKLKITANIVFEYKEEWDSPHIEVSLTFDESLTATVEKTFSATKTLAQPKAVLFYGLITISCDINLVVDARVAATFTYHAKGKVGAELLNSGKAQPINEYEDSMSLQIEGTIDVCLQLVPKIDILGIDVMGLEVNVAHVEITLAIGANLALHADFALDPGDLSNHKCQACIYGTAQLYWQVCDLKVEALKIFKKTFMENTDKMEIGSIDAYFCMDEHNQKDGKPQFHWKEKCPYLDGGDGTVTAGNGELLIRVKYNVNDTLTPAEDAQVTAVNAKDSADTKTTTADAQGQAKFTGLTAGANYLITVKTPGGLIGGGNVILNRDAKKGTEKTIFVSMKRVKQFVTHGTTSAALVGNELYLWGSNGYGQLGNNTTTSSSLPVAPDKLTYHIGNSEIKRVVTSPNGRITAIIVGPDNEIWMWGENNYGQLGTGSADNYKALPMEKVKLPVGLRSPNDFYLYNDFAAAVASDGSLYMWGDNGDGGCLGNNSTTLSRIPVKVSFPQENDTTNYEDKIMTDSPVVKFTSDGSRCGAILSNGSLYIWGYFGNGVKPQEVSYYQKIPFKYSLPENLTLSSVADFQSSDNTWGILLRNGDLWMWGSNLYGELGNGSTTGNAIPAKVPYISGSIKQFIINGNSVGAVTTDGALYMWGDNDYGCLGLGDTSDKRTAELVTDSGVKEVKIRNNLSGTLMTDGSLRLWGHNWDGELGNGESSTSNNKNIYSFKDASVPMNNVTSFMISDSGYVGAITDTGLYMWGRNTNGCLGIGNTSNQSTPQFVTLPPVTAVNTAFSDEMICLAASDVSAGAGSKTASFTGLTPGETYAVYEMRERFTENDLAPNNLLYISQAVADADGTLTIHYTPIVNVEDTAIFAVGAKSIVLTEDTVEITIPDIPYTGEQQGPSITIMYQGKLLTEGVDYEVSGDWFGTDIGTYTITITGTGIYTGSFERTYQIIAAEENPEEPTETETETESTTETETSTVPEHPTETETETETEHPSETETSTEPESPSETETSTEPESPVETETPTETEISSETETPTEPESPVEPSQPVQIQDTDAKLEVYIPSLYFNNKVQIAKPSVFYDNEKLTEGIDYTVTYPDDQRSAGEHTLKLAFMGDYTGEVTRGYTIYQKNTANVVNITKKKFSLNASEVKNAFYTGTAIRPAVISKDTTLKENADYKVVYKNNYHAGKAIVTIIGLKNTNSGTAYAGTKTLNFTIKKTNIKTGVQANRYKNTYAYTGSPVTLEDLILTCGTYTLRQGTDYTISYSKNRTAGTATATVKGIGNFTGSTKYQFTIHPVSLTELPANAVTSLPYSPKGAKLKSITFGDITLQEGTDYSAKYTYSDKKNKAVGSTVTIVLTGKNACKGTKKQFDNIPIVPADFSSCIVKSSPLVIDAAKPNKRTVKVTNYAGVALKVNKDYTLAWDTHERTDGTECTLTLSPLNASNYTGVKTVTYRIAQNLSKQKGITIKDKIYNGRTPVQLRASDFSGLDAADFDIIHYKNNTKAGTAQVTIQGKGRYYGTKTLKFKITD